MNFSLKIMNKLNSLAPPDVEQDEDLDFVAILDVLIENRRMICAIVSACFALAVLYAFLADPIFQSDIMVQVEESPDTSAAKSMLGDVSSLFDVKSTAAAESQILGSRLVVGRAVDQLNLFIQAEPRRFPVIGGWLARLDLAPFSTGFLGFTWGPETINVAKFDVPSMLEGVPFRVTVVAPHEYELSGSRLTQPIKIDVGRPQIVPTEYGDIYLEIRHIYGGIGSSFRLTRYSRDETVSEIQHALDIEEKIKDSGVLIASLQDNTALDVSRELNEIGRQYIRQNVERKSAEAAQSLAFLDERLPQIKAKLNAAQSRYTEMRNAHGVIDLTEEAKLDLGQATDAQARLLEMKQKREELRLRFGPSHPAILSLSAQINELESYQRTVEAKIKALPDSEQSAVRLLLDVQVNTDLYTSLLSSYQQLQLVKAGKTGNVRLVDVASMPDKPVKPKRLLVIAGGLAVGLAMGVIAAFLRDVLFRGVTDPNEIERRAQLGVYATIPYSTSQVDLIKQARNKKGQPSLLALNAPHEPAIESLRSLRTSIQFAMLGAKNNVVLVGGPTPGVGKSFVSANFAAVLAASGKRVLLIDMDLRKGYLHQYFDLERSFGVSDVIAGSQTLEHAIHREVASNLDFISTGVLPPAPAELLLSPAVETLIQTVSKSYDIVLIDSPPVLAVADACILAPAAGTVLLVAYSGTTKMGEITESVKRLRNAGSAVGGVVFNGMRTTGRYGYGSKYASYRYVDYKYSPKQGV